jgi:DNA-binding transcriptional regulator YiaG
MPNRESESKSRTFQNLSSAQVTAIVQRTGLSREELAQQLGCGTSQLFKYEKEGLPPRMNKEVKAAILQLGIETQVLPANAATRAVVSKLSKAG